VTIGIFRLWRETAMLLIQVLILLLHKAKSMTNSVLFTDLNFFAAGCHHLLCTTSTCTTYRTPAQTLTTSMDFFEPFAISNEPASLHDGSESEHMQMLVDQNEFDHDLTMPITQFEGVKGRTHCGLRQ
jgi:hypothetical protein